MLRRFIQNVEAVAGIIVDEFLLLMVLFGAAGLIIGNLILWHSESS